MAYTRRQTQDGVTVMNKDLYDNLQDGIEERGITPEMFGAVGDGVHDDTEAIKRALKCKNKIILLRGTYLISSFLILPSNTHIFGYDSTIIFSDNFERFTDAFYIINSSYYEDSSEIDSNISLHGITLTSKKIGEMTSQKVMLGFRRTDGVTLEDCSFIMDKVSDRIEPIHLRGDNYNTSFIRCKFLDSQNAEGGGGICIYNFDSIRDSYNTLFESCYFEKKNTDEILYVDARHSSKSVGTIKIQNCTFKTIFSDSNTDRMVSIYTDFNLKSHGKILIKDCDFLVESCNDNIFYDGTTESSDGIFLIDCIIKVPKSCVGRMGSHSNFLRCYIDMGNSLTYYNYFVNCTLTECVIYGTVPDEFSTYIFVDSNIKNSKLILNSGSAEYFGFSRCTLENCTIEKCKVVNLIQNPKSVVGNHILEGVSISNLFCNFTKDPRISYEGYTPTIKGNVFDIELTKIYTSVTDIFLVDNICKGLSVNGISGKNRIGKGNIYTSLAGSFTLESGNLLLT